MKKSELRKIIKEELVNEKYNYEAEQMDLAEKDNDWKYGMSVQFRGSKNHSKWLLLDKQKFEKIKAIICK